MARPASSRRSLLAGMLGGHGAGVRWQALLLACFTLASQIAGSLHLALVAHERCAEHGELVDRGGGRAPGPGHHGVASSLAPDADEAGAALGDRGGAPAAEDHGHDHCLLSPFRRDRSSVADATRPEPLAAPEAAAAARHAAPGLAPAGIALLRLAPKSSPPA